MYFSDMEIPFCCQGKSDTLIQKFFKRNCRNVLRAFPVSKLAPGPRWLRAFGRRQCSPGQVLGYETLVTSKFSDIGPHILGGRGCAALVLCVSHSKARVCNVVAPMGAQTNSQAGLILISYLCYGCALNVRKVIGYSVGFLVRDRNTLTLLQIMIIDPKIYSHFTYYTGYFTLHAVLDQYYFRID